MAVGEAPAVVGEIKEVGGETAAEVGLMAVVEAPAAKESRGLAEVAGEVVGEAVEAVAVAAAVTVAMAFEAGGRPSTALKNPLL